jgi:Tol biopolymer transport system component
MVGRFIEQQHVGLGKQQAAERDATSFAAGGTPEIVYEAPYGVGLRHLAWSSDGTRIAFTENAGGWSVRVMERSTGLVTHTLVTGQFAPFGLDWARQGFDTLAFANEAESPTTIYTLDIDSGQTAAVIDGTTPNWSPDNTKMVYGTSGRKARIATVDLSNGETDTLASGVFPTWRRF